MDLQDPRIQKMLLAVILSACVVVFFFFTNMAPFTYQSGAARIALGLAPAVERDAVVVVGLGEPRLELERLLHVDRRVGAADQQREEGGYRFGFEQNPLQSYAKPTRRAG